MDNEFVSMAEEAVAASRVLALGSCHDTTISRPHCATPNMRAFHRDAAASASLAKGLCQRRCQGPCMRRVTARTVNAGKLMALLLITVAVTGCGLHCCSLTSAPATAAPDVVAWSGIKCPTLSREPSYACEN